MISRFLALSSLFNKLWLHLRSRKSLVSIETTHNTNSPLMHQLPNDVVKKIFSNLCTRDRVRMSLVSKSWRRVLMQDDNIPLPPESPWLILSNDSYSKPKYFLSELRFESPFEDKIYRFKLPKSISNNGKDKWCCCGSSRGWLLIAVGRNLHKVDMYLWNPISGRVQKLPSLSTLPFFNQFVDQAVQLGGEVVNMSSFIQRMQVSAECVVAIIFIVPTFYPNPQHQLALCTPHDHSWTAVGGGEKRNLYYSILFRNEKLYASCKLLEHGEEDKEREQEHEETIDDKRTRKNECIVHLSNGLDVEVILLRFAYKKVVTHLPNEFPIGFSILKRVKMEYLVESCTDHELLVVTAVQDLCTHVNMEDYEIADLGPVQTFHHCQTKGFEVRRMVGDYLEEVNGSIGEQGIYIGCNGSLCLPTSYGNEVEQDCIYFAIDDGALILGLNRIDEEQFSWDNLHIVHEQGFFSLRDSRIRIDSLTNVRFASGSFIGWFTPKLF